MKKHLSEMQKVKPDLQPDQISDAALVAFFSRHLNVEVIKNFYGMWMIFNIEMTVQMRAKLLKDGKPADEAAARALLRYAFRDAVGLYFEMTGGKVSPEYIRLMEYTVKLLAASEKPEAADIPVEWSLENVAAFERWYESGTAEYETKLEEAEKEKKNARLSLEENHRELSRLKSQLIQTENGGNALQQTLNETREQLHEAQAMLQIKEEELKQQEEALKNSQAKEAAESVPEAPAASERKTYTPAQDLKFMAICRPYVDERGTARSCVWLM